MTELRIRCDDNVKVKLEREAATNHRSLSAEVLVRLLESLKAKK